MTPPGIISTNTIKPSTRTARKRVKMPASGTWYIG
jgi:hypothetical protein